MQGQHSDTNQSQKSHGSQLDAFDFIDQGKTEVKKQSNFRKIMKRAELEVKESISVLENPSKYFEDDEDLNSVQREVIKGMQSRNTQ